MTADVHTLRLVHRAQADGLVPAGLLAESPAFQELVERRRRALADWLREAARDLTVSDDSQDR